MKKILIATPMLPPTLGGPAIHAEKLEKYFVSKGDRVEIFNFEKLNSLPAGIRHFVAFVQIFLKSLGKDIIFALDGFSVALPAVLVAILLRKKIALRIGGDLVHEQYVERGGFVSLNDFYLRLKEGQIVMRGTLKLKLFIQKFVLKYSSDVVFTTDWQKDIYSDFYELPKNVWTINNPLPEDNINILEYTKYDHNRKVFLSATRDVLFKNIKNLKLGFEEAKKVLSSIDLDTDISDRKTLLSRIKSARCYICVSISDISPNTVLDALSLGTPVILTKNTGFYKLLEGKGVVRFVDPYDVEEIKKAILEMCDDNIWQTYRNNLQNFSWGESWSSLFEKYERILSEEM
jgi:glycosyltransferase involved in cell wall biosynthesis